MSESFPGFSFDEDPDAPGWKRWELSDPTLYNSFLGPIRVRAGNGIARVRMTPERRHSNLAFNVHGGAMLGFIDVALFAGARGLEALPPGPAATVDLSVQFLASGDLGQPLEAQVELLRATRRLLFLRGLIVQDAGPVASFSGTVRKPTA